MKSMSVAFTAAFAASRVARQSYTAEERDLRSKQTGMWRPYEAFNRALIKQVKADDVVQDFYPPHEADDGYTKAILIKERYPKNDDTHAFLSKNTPKSERIKLEGIKKIALLIKKRLSLGFKYKEPWTGEGTPWNPTFEKMVPDLPLRPLDFMPGADAVAGVLTRGPFSVFSKVDKESGDLFIDLSIFEDVQPRKPFVKVGGVARVSLNEDGTKYVTKSITFDGTVYTPASNGYHMARKRFLAALNNYTTFIDHLTYCHILGAQNNALAIFENLPSNHHLRILMQPFITETTKVNNELIDGLIKFEKSNVPSYSGFNLTDLAEMMRRHVKNEFDIRHLDPVQRYTTNGLPLDDTSLPTIQSTVKIFQIYRQFTEAWCKEFFENGELDSATKGYLSTLQAQTPPPGGVAGLVPPGGVAGLVGKDNIDDITVSDVAHIIATLMYTGSLWHHNCNDNIAGYFLSFDVMPTAIDKNGFPTKGVVLEKRNSIVAAYKHRYYILPKDGQKTKSIKDVLPDQKMKDIYSDFENNLKAYKTYTDSLASDMKEFVIDPYKITSSIHA